jgi:Protein of unknown function (DUF3435)
MYIEEMAEFPRALLSTTEMTFPCGWLQIQLLLFCQLAAITGNRSGCFLNLRYRDLLLTLIHDPAPQAIHLLDTVSSRPKSVFVLEQASAGHVHEKLR